MKKQAKLFLRSFIVAFSCFILTVVLQVCGVFDFFENKTYDSRMQFAAGHKEPSSKISFIIVDQYSINWAKENYGWNWPWPREAYARLIDFLSAGNPKSIAFDIIYSEPSVYGSQDDEILGLAEANSGVVIQTVFIDETNETNPVQLPVDTIKNNAALLGNITSAMDADDIIRRGRLQYEYDGVIYPTLGTAPIYLEGRQETLKNLPVLKDGTVLLRYQKNLESYLPYSFADILESYENWKAGKESFFSPEDFAGNYIYVAYYAPGLFDICSTPVSKVSPGVGVHITTLDNYLTNSFMHKVPEIPNILWMLILSVFAAAFVYYASKMKSQGLTVLSLAGGFILGLALILVPNYLLFIKGYWLYLIAPFFCFMLSIFINIILYLTMEGKQKRFITKAFSQCLSKDVVNEIVANPDSFTLGGKKYIMSAIFTDIQKFSSFSELLTAEELGELLNFYLTRMSNIIMNEGGTIDKYEGDAIVALVGAPLEMKDHAERACRAAINMKKDEVLLNAEIRDAVTSGDDKGNPVLFSAFKKMVENNKEIFTRIGINSGEMTAGYFGSENKKNYTMMGNNVNLASRLEGVNKQYSTGGILISDATREFLGDTFVLRKLDRVQVVNVKTPIRLYELLDEKVKALPELINFTISWDNAIENFENGNYKAALEAFKDLQESKSEDKVSAYYIKLIEKYFVKGMYPVDSDDEGVSYNNENPADMNPEWIGTKNEIKGSFKLLQK